jgi:hypothetical protein
MRCWMKAVVGGFIGGNLHRDEFALIVSRHNPNEISLPRVVGHDCCRRQTYNHTCGHGG